MLKVYALLQKKDWILPYWDVEEAELLNMEANTANINIGHSLHAVVVEDLYCDVHAAMLEMDRRNLRNAELNEAYLTLVKLLKR